MAENDIVSPLLPSDRLRNQSNGKAVVAEDDLISPLLPSDRLPSQSNGEQVILTIDDQLNSDRPFNNHFLNDNDGDAHLQIHNPFEFLGAGSFTVPAPTTIDPFRNHTLRIEGIYEWLKIVICLPIALLRLLLFLLFMSFGFLATKVALYGWRDKHNPMPKWRCRIMWITRISARFILFTFGYHWIKRKGRPTSRQNAPIVVSNHVSYIDPIFFFYELFPTIVASESHDSLPFVGTIIRAMQVIYVNRFSPSSRKLAVNEIKRKASSDRFPRVLLFPEGTTTNGRVVISFQLGAFIPGYPIQPVIVRYPHVHFDQSWGHISVGRLMFRMFTQFHNFMEVEYLPVVSPPDDQKENAVNFAERTSNAIASALNVVETCHSYGDLMLLTRASQLKKDQPSRYMVEMARVESLFHIGNLEAVDFLDKFLSMNPDSSGCVHIHDFLRVLRLKACSLSEKIFEFLDVEKNGKITFRQFLYGSAHVMRQPLFRQACELAFAKCDRTGNNYISRNELGDSVRPAIPNLNEDEVNEMYDLFDVGNDGRVDKEDFVSCLRKNPLLIPLFSSVLRREDLLEDGDSSLEETL